MRLLGTPRLTWRRLAVHVTQSTADPTSALWRDLAGDQAEWDLHAHLLAAVAHATRVLAWQNTKDATATPPKNYPEPIGPSRPQPEPAKPQVTPAALADFRKRIGGE